MLSHIQACFLLPYSFLGHYFPEVTAVKCTNVWMDLRLFKGRKNKWIYDEIELAPIENKIMKVV